MTSTLQDIRFAFRQLRKNPVFTTAAVLTLALGIGANTAMFSIVNTVLLRPLPYPQPDRLVTLWERSSEKGLEEGLVSGPNFLDWRDQSHVFDQIAVSPAWHGVNDFNLVLRDGTTKIQASYVSASLFPMFAVNPLLGRAFLPEEDQPKGNRVAVLSYGLWQRHFGGDSNVLGQSLTLDTYGRRDYTIVGVMPAGFGLPSRSELWLPLGWMGVKLDERRSAHWHHVTARLKPGITVDHARRELTSIQARIKQAHPDAIIGREVAVVPLLEHALGQNMRSALLILWGVVAGVLLIACANVANLMLVRAAARQKEIALRLALGASRGRLVRQLLAESLVVALIGGVLGALLAVWGIQLFVAANPGNIPRLSGATVDGTALGFTILLSILTGLLFGLAPAWQFSRPDLNRTLQESTHSASAGFSLGRLRGLLVIGEVGLSLVLLVAAGLMLQSFARLLRAERGLQPEHLLTAQLDFSVSGFTTWVRPTATRPQVPLRELLERLRQYPGVQSVGAASGLPRQDRNPPNQPVTVFGRPPLKPEDRLNADHKGITPDFLRALGVPLLRGRPFTEADTLTSRGVALINQTLARRVFPNEDPIGKFITMGDQATASLDATDQYGIYLWSEIIGVVGDVKTLTADPMPVPEVYRPYWQWPMQSPVMAVRATGDPLSLSAAIRTELQAVLPQLPAPAIRSMDEILADTLAQPRLQSRLLGLFGIVALVLAAGGLYGVLAYVVSQRTHEIGIRLALGAQKGNVLSLVIAQGMKLALIGVGIGLAAALALARVMRSLLYDVRPTDPLTFVAVSFLLTTIALLACWVPARRAAKVNPMEALRCE
jgi:putative ABC transport system permease protein